MSPISNKIERLGWGGKFSASIHSTLSLSWKFCKRDYRSQQARQKTGWKAMEGFSLSWTIIVLCWMVMKTWGGEWLKEVLFTCSTTNHYVHKVLSHWVHKSSFWKERYCFFHSVCFINIKCERVSPPSGKSMGKVRPSSSPPLYSFSRKGIKRHVSQVEWWYMMWDRKFETEDARSLTSLVLWQNVPNNMFLEKF